MRLAFIVGYCKAAFFYGQKDKLDALSGPFLFFGKSKGFLPGAIISNFKKYNQWKPSVILVLGSQLNLTLISNSNLS